MSSRNLLKTGLVIAALALCGCGEDPLLKAARANKLDTVKTLVEQRSASVDAQDENGHTALMAAASNGSRDVVEYLLSRGAKVDLANREGWTPLAYAVTVQETEGQSSVGAEIVRLLIGQGADVNARFSHFQDGKRTILMQAVASAGSDKAEDKGYQSVLSLLEKGAQVDAQDDRGETALMYAVRAARPAVVTLLLKSRASTTIKNNDGKTAVDIARDLGKAPVIEALTTAGKAS